MEFAPVYLYSATKTVINSKYDLNKSFQEILNRINNRSNEGSGWVIESVDAEYMNISLFSPLSGSTYIKLPRRLRNSVKSLIIIKNSNNKCFLWCHIRHLNPLKIHPERITKADKNMVIDLDYESFEFPVSKKDFGKIEQKSNVCICVVFFYENNLVNPVYISDQNFKDCIDLLMITNENKSHYVYIKDFDGVTSNKAKCKNNVHFCKYFLHFSSARVLVEHKETL